MGPTKAPGPDGFHALFFQKNWELDLFRICLGVLNKGQSVRALKTTHVVLIPKITNPRKVSNVTYKVITKVLANRLKVVLPEIISQEQSTSVPGRLIMDNVLVAFELLHSIGRKVGGKEGLMGISLT